MAKELYFHQTVDYIAKRRFRVSDTNAVILGAYALQASVGPTTDDAAAKELLNDQVARRTGNIFFFCCCFYFLALSVHCWRPDVLSRVGIFSPSPLPLVLLLFSMLSR